VSVVGETHVEALAREGEADRLGHVAGVLDDHDARGSGAPGAELVCRRQRHVAGACSASRSRRSPIRRLGATPSGSQRVGDLLQALTETEIETADAGDEGQPS
jgi:hypothetical protein